MSTHAKVQEADGKLLVKIGYLDGAVAAADYAADGAKAASLCVHTLTCGQALSISASEAAASPSPLDALGPASDGAVLIRIGETHSLSAELRVSEARSSVSQPGASVK